jgi:hypothetical protein
MPLCRDCKAAVSDPSLPPGLRGFCRECYRRRRREYMRARRDPTTKRYMSWRGTVAYGCIKTQVEVRAEARSRGVPIETVIQEWGLRA